MHQPNRSVFLWLLLVPRNAGIAILKLYRAVVSPLYGDVCRYYPSCSRYSLDAIARFGLLAGCALTIRRLVRCNPWAAGGVDDVPSRNREWAHRTRWGFVAPGAEQPERTTGSWT